MAKGGVLHTDNAPLVFNISVATSNHYLQSVIFCTTTLLFFLFYSLPARKQRGRKKREKETVGVLCYVCTEYVHTNTLYSVSSGFCLVYLQKAETESMAITSMAGGPIPSQKALFGKRNKVHTVWTINDMFVCFFLCYKDSILCCHFHLA